MIVVKVGGSAITDKSSFRKPKIDVIDCIARDIAEVSPRLILIHGAGSFGHPFVVRYGLNEFEDLDGVIEAHMSCKDLNILVCRAMINHGVRPFPIHPFSTFKIEGGRIKFDRGLILSSLRKGFVPVLHGDMVFNSDVNRFVVLSGDDITLEIAKVFRADKVGFATDVDGVYLNGKLSDVVTLKDLDKIGLSSGIDVTGGMRSKVEKILRSGVEARIFNVSNLKEFLMCRNVGTLVKLLK